MANRPQGGDAQASGAAPEAIGIDELFAKIDKRLAAFEQTLTQAATLQPPNIVGALRNHLTFILRDVMMAVGYSIEVGEQAGQVANQAGQIAGQSMALVGQTITNEALSELEEAHARLAEVLKDLPDEHLAWEPLAMMNGALRRLDFLNEGGDEAPEAEPAAGSAEEAPEAKAAVEQIASALGGGPTTLPAAPAGGGLLGGFSRPKPVEAAPVQATPELTPAAPAEPAVVEAELVVEPTP